MPDDFRYDVFLSHSAKDRAVVRPLTERLRKDGLLNFSFGFRVSKFGFPPLAACLSANAFGSDWAQLESGTFRFRDPLNKDRCFIPLRLDDTPIKGSLAQFLYINIFGSLEAPPFSEAQMIFPCVPGAGFSPAPAQLLDGWSESPLPLP